MVTLQTGTTVVCVVEIFMNAYNLNFRNSGKCCFTNVWDWVTHPRSIPTPVTCNTNPVQSMSNECLMASLKILTYSLQIHTVSVSSNMQKQIESEELFFFFMAPVLLCKQPYIRLCT